MRPFEIWQMSVNISKTVQDRDILTLQWKTNRKSHTAYQMATMPLTLNDPEDHFSHVTLFNSLFWKYDPYFNTCTRIEQHTWPVTLNELKGHSSVSGLFKCKSSTFVQHFTRFETDTLASHSPSAKAGLLVLNFNSVQLIHAILCEARYCSTLSWCLYELEELCVTAHMWILQDTFWDIFINHFLHFHLQVMQTGQNSFLPLFQCFHTCGNWLLCYLSTQAKIHHMHQHTQK